MASAAVRFHPAAAQEAESTYDWYAARSPEAAHGFREELRRAIDAVAASPRTWPRYGSRARRYVFPRYPFSLVYSCAAMPSKLSPWPMVVGGLGTGGRASDKPFNFRMQLTALRAAADTAR
jgi:plasmid stabilization system protein ParE